MTDQPARAKEIERMQVVLDTGKWPTGLPVNPSERRTIEHNLELLRRRP